MGDVLFAVGIGVAIGLALSAYGSDGVGRVLQAGWSIWNGLFVVALLTVIAILTTQFSWWVVLIGLGAGFAAYELHQRRRS